MASQQGAYQAYVPASNERRLSETTPQVVRWDEPLKFVPIIFVSCVIAFLYLIYVFGHCIPMLQLGEKEDHVDEEAAARAIKQLVWFHIITLFLLICYVMSILTHPGTIPEGDDRWEYETHPKPPNEINQVLLKEAKRTGDRRHCKWCGKYKPDRCHHCRVCRVCILKMDHHCPWIYNCVGFRNYKCFFLLLVWCMLDCHLIVWTMFESVMTALTTNDVPFMKMFILLFGETLAFFFCGLTTLFLGFHIYLMVMAMTTIEFCEKALPKNDGAGSPYSSVFNRGIYSNITSVLGDNPLLWFVPGVMPSGDGCTYLDSSTPLVEGHLKHQKVGGATPPYSNEQLGSYSAH